LDDRVPLGLGHVDHHPVAQDAGVVHDDVDRAERVDRELDEALRAVPGGDVLGVGDGLAAGCRDLVHDLLGGSGVAGSAAVTGPADVVDDDLGALFGEEQRMRPADAATGTSDRDNPTVTQPAHALPSTFHRMAGWLPSGHPEGYRLTAGEGLGCETAPTCGDAGSGPAASGSRTVNVVPTPSSLFTSTVPPWAATRAATIESPSPEPP